MTAIGLPLPDIVPVLRGPRLALRPPVPSDTGVIARLGVDPAIERFFGTERLTRRGLTTDEARRSLARLSGPGRTQGWVVEEGTRLVGLARLFAVEPGERRARYAMTLLSHDLVGHGLGTEITRLVLTYGFAVLGLHRVSARVLDFNERALACLRSCGFVEEGRERESAFFEGEQHDVVTMGVLDREFGAVAAARPECAGLSALARVVRDELAGAALERNPART
jgi:[ribosomal protein S5]-alanine N-acetyltransferase